MEERQAYEKSSLPMTRKQIILNNFIGGLFWGMGSAIGAALLVFVLGYILAKINIVPMIGTFVSEVAKVVEQQNSR